MFTFFLFTVFLSAKYTLYSEVPLQLVHQFQYSISLQYLDPPTLLQSIKYIFLPTVCVYTTDHIVKYH